MSAIKFYHPIPKLPTENLAPALTRNTRSLEEFLNTYTIRLDSVTGIVALPAASTVGGVAIGTGTSSVAELSDLSDVNTSTITDKFVLVADGVDFESRVLVEADISDLVHVASQFLPFGVTGELEVGERAFRFIFPFACTVVGIQITCGVAPTGASVKVDFHIDGTTIYTTQANRPEVAISGTDSTQTVPDVTAILADEVLTIGIDQIGSTLPGENLTCIIELTVP